MDPKETTMIKPEGSPEIKPDPAVSAETNGHVAGEKKVAPLECPVKSIKCTSCGKAVELPRPVIDALNALIESAQSIVSQNHPTSGQDSHVSPDIDDAVPDQPGISQGMAPENHEEGKAVEDSEMPAKPLVKRDEQTAVKAADIESIVRTAVEEATKSFKERITTLELEPANNGPVRRATKTVENPKMGNEPTASVDRIKAIKTIIETTDNESLKTTLGWELAQLEMSGVIAKGPQSPW